jgi:hypothetical protein
MNPDKKKTTGKVMSEERLIEIRDSIRMMNMPDVKV